MENFMKLALTFLLLLVFSIPMTTIHAQEFKKLEAQVTGMRCQNCVQAITKALKTHAAVADVEVQLKEKKVLISLHEGVVVENSELEQLITAEGYKVIAIQEVSAAKAD
jgi:copper chaperone CopZ